MTWPAFALDPTKPIADFIHETWSVDNGLPQGTIRAIAQTKDGYIWFGTHEGLVRFDGRELTVFNEANTPTLRGNSVAALLHSRSGGLYLGLRDGGVVRYNYGVFSVVELGAELANVSASVLAEDITGALWVGTSGRGVVRVSDGAVRVFTSKDGLPHDNVTAIKASATGEIWVGTFRGLALVRGDKLIVNPTGAMPDKTYIASIFEDHEKQLWLATFGDGLYRWAQAELRHFDQRDGLIGDTFNRVFEDSKGSIWIGGLDGLQRLVGERFESYTTADGLSNNFVRDILQDTEGSLWVGTDLGIDRFRDGRVAMWGKRQGLAEEFARTVIEDRAGNVWVGTADGLFRFAPLTAVAGAKPDYKVTRYGREQGHTNAAILSLDEAPDGAIWIGTNVGGLHRLRAQAKNRIENMGANMALGAASVRAISAGRDGTVWVGTNTGLFRWRPDAPAMRVGKADGLPSDQVVSLYEDGKKTLWVGLRNGITRIEDGKVIANPPGFAFDGTVFSFNADATGVVWLATARGLAVIKENALRFFKQNDGVPERAFFNVLDDRQGNLWMCSNQGLVRAAKGALAVSGSGVPIPGSTETLGRSDGMATVQCNGSSGPSSWLTKDGRLLFATARGVATIDGARAQPSVPPPPQVHLRDVEVNGASTGATKLLKLAPGDHRLEIRYVAVRLDDPSRLRFRYRLQGFDEKWLNAADEQRAVYTNVPAGNFRFQISAGNQAGGWSDPQTLLDLTVDAHFYNTWWFRIVGVFAMLGGFLLVYRWRVRSLNTRAKVLKLQVEARTHDLANQTKLLQAANDEKGKLLVKVEGQARAFELLSKEDPLTGLANRRELERFLTTEVERAQRNQRPLCLVMADIDFFKSVNDRFSHTTGDDVLRAVAKLFLKRTRSIDMAARFGGEELVLVLPETSIAEAEMLSERLRDEVEHHPWLELHPELEVTMSFGVASIGTHTTSSAFLSAADQRLYAAKRAGRNRVMA